VRRFFVLLFVVLLALACGKKNAPDLLIEPADAGVDAASDFDAQAGPDGSTVDPTLGGPCDTTAQCDDKVDCTSDHCDLSLHRCRFLPDDSLCDDGKYCNGKEVCTSAGCRAGAVVTCQDDNSCTIDSCVEADQSCKHAPRDVDQDGDTDAHCLMTGGDCDDTDPLVSEKAQEVCNNGKDDNCDGKVDEQPCVLPANDTCANALAVTTAGSYTVSTVATKKDYVESCNVTTPTAARDVVVAITAPGNVGDAASDIDVWIGTADAESTVALFTTCAASEIECQDTGAGTRTRVRGRSIAAGTTVYAVITTQSEASVAVHVDFLPPTTKPANEDCTAPLAIPVDSPVAISIVDAAHDLASDCNAKTGELTFAFTLNQARDVHVLATTTAGDGTAVLSLRAADCVDELRCRVGNTPPLFARNLSAGTYVLSVSATASIDASLIVQTSAPTTAPPNQTCATAPAAPSNAEINIDLGNQEDAIKNGCLGGAPNAAYDLSLAVPSDVLIVARFAQGDFGAVSLSKPTCVPADLISCNQGATPLRISKRNLAAGDYRIVIADLEGHPASLMLLTRPTATATNVGSGSDDCMSPTAVSPTGGFYTGDTSKAKPDFNAGCDVGGAPPGGAPDQILSLALPAQQRMIFDMSGSTYATILDIRSGVICPATEVPNACYVGFNAQRSFLDVTLPAGQYWVQVDGFNQQAGSWNLDVRTLPP